MATLQSAILKLWVYDGLAGSYNVNAPNYTITKTKLPNENDIIFEISELARDYINIQFDGDYTLANISSWVSYFVTYTFDDGTTSIKTGDLLGTHAYGYFEDEINPQLTSPLQQSNTCIYWKKGEPVRIPVYSGLTLYDVEWYEDDELLDKSVYGTNLFPITADTTKYTADNVSTLRASSTHIENQYENDYTVSVWGPLNANRVIIKTRDGQEVELTITLVEECKNTPYKVTFINKFGVLQDIWMFGRRKERANASREFFKINTIETNETTTFYKTSRATDRIHNVTTNKSLTLNTSFVCEDYNQVVQELLLSEYVWIHENNKVYPIVPKDNVVEYKTHLYDKLLNYTINFDYAYSEINLVR